MAWPSDSTWLCSCWVDRIEPGGFQSLRLEIPGPEGQDTLGDAKGEIILWEKKLIKLLGSAPMPPPPPSRRSPSPPPSCRRSPSPSPNDHGNDNHSASPSRSPPPSQHSSPPPPPAKNRSATTQKRAFKSPPRKLPPLPRVPTVPPPRAYDRTVEENEAIVQGEVDAHFHKKKTRPPGAIHREGKGMGS